MTTTPPPDTRSYQTRCKATWQVENAPGGAYTVKCRHCGVYVQARGTPKCLAVDSVNLREAMQERQQWFYDRIGKRVYRNTTTCPCEPCRVVTEKGLVIQDEMHASYLYDMEGAYFHDGAKLRYFDTKEESVAYETERGQAKHTGGAEGNKQ